ETNLALVVGKLIDRSTFDANKMGVAFWKQSQNGCAASVFQAVVAKDETYVSAWVNLGVNRQALSEFKLAEEAFKRALALNPHDDFAKESYQKFVVRNEVLESTPQ